MAKTLPIYEAMLGENTVAPLVELAQSLKGAKIVHINSTKEGGGVAEILMKMVPLMQELGLDVQWETIQGDPLFFQCTKLFHNLLQGENLSVPSFAHLKSYEKTNAENAAVLKNLLADADFVFIHDPQPLALIEHFPERKGKWFWRCHIDLSSPSKTVWNYLKKQVELYDGSIFSLRDFAQKLPHPIYIIPPSIDPLSEKNIELEEKEIQNVYLNFKIDRGRPVLLQVSRFDRFKDPIGVIQSYRIAKKADPSLQLVLAGSGADDDPEGTAVLRQVEKAAANDPDIHILLLPPTSHRAINALQRGASIVLQKSIREGFGLTVSEALWKSKPVIGGNCGGIRLQIIQGETGFLVETPEEAGEKIGFLLNNPRFAEELASRGKQLVKDKFLITRHLKDYLSAMSLQNKKTTENR